MAALAPAFEQRMTFEETFLAEYARVASIARRIVGDAATAEDVAQEVFAAYARRFAMNPSQSSGWLYVTATRFALNEVRRRRRADRRERRDFMLRSSGATRAQADLDPQIVLEREHMRRMVGAAMLRLPERSAAILALKYGGLTYREIALTLGVAESNIGTYVVRAERAFRKEIEDEQR